LNWRRVNVKQFDAKVSVFYAIVFTVGAWVMPAVGAVVSSADTSFPTAPAFRTIDPANPSTPVLVERTVREDATLAAGTRILNQTFQLGSDLTVGDIDILFVRGASGNVGILKIFSVANTRADDFTTDAAGTPLLNVQFTMPGGLDPLDNTQRTLHLDLTDADEITLPATTGTAGYMLSISSTVDGDTGVNREIFTWRMGEGPAGTTNTERLNNSFYVPGRVAYDDFNAASNSERQRDAVFALVAVPEPASLGLIGLAGLALARRRRRT
jgi:hypothetical protein